jgi:hypothetical protein
MPRMGRYCKAYPISRLREYKGWTEKAQNARKEKQEIDGKEIESPRELSENDYLYLQENFTVTDGIYLDENIIFDQVSAEWEEFCKAKLGFELPVYQSARPVNPE